MVNDYIPITAEGPLLGSWWRRPPHIIRRETYAPYRREGLRPVPVEADVLVPSCKRTKRYEPATETELLNALLDMAQDRLTPVAFANRFGLLGYNYVVPQENHCRGGDPLDWFLAHARTVHTVAELIRRLRDARAGGRFQLATYLRKEITDGPYVLNSAVARIPRQGFRSPIFAAIGIVSYLLNANLGEAGRRLQSTSARGLRTVFTFRNLAQVIYWQLADQLGSSSIRRCRECGRTFVHPNVRAQFCPPAEGQKISRCKSRWNVREFRRKKRQRRKR